MSGERILIIDDDLETLRLVGMMLERQGYTIIAANSGNSGLERAAQEQPDLIILDIMMPDMNGYDVARRLRMDSSTAHIPIIMFTAKTMVEEKVAGFEAGADDYLTKPTHPAELASRIKALLGRRSERTSAAAPSQAQHGKIVAFLGAKGGVGTTTLAMNCAIVIAQILKDSSVILAELRPGQGNIGLLMDHPHAEGLTNLLSRGAGGITPRAIEAELLAHRAGLRALSASPHPTSYDAELTPDTAELLVRNTATLGDLLIADLGSGLDERAGQLSALADQVILTVEPTRVALVLAHEMIDNLRDLGIGPTRLGVVLVNRTPSGLSTSWRTAQEQLGIELLGIIPPAPELAYQAAESGTPLILIPSAAASTLAVQLRDLSQKLLARLGLTGEEA